MEEAFLPYFDYAETVKTFESRRGGKLVRYFTVYKLNGYNQSGR
ncbi:MAG: hypothetical protein WDN75_13520 [Bacteroidota bacterium]